MTEQNEDRLDRIERILEQSAKEHAEWFTHIERMFANAAEQFNRNEERFSRNEERFVAATKNDSVATKNCSTATKNDSPHWARDLTSCPVISASCTLP